MKTAFFFRARELTHFGPGKGLTVIQGEAGAGKTWMAEKILSREKSVSDVLVLKSCCSFLEQVPYNALDAVMDQLCQYFLQDPFAPASLLSELTAPVAPGPLYKGKTGMIHYRKGMILGRIMNRIMENRPVLLFIDDAQFCDLESIMALSGLISHFNLESGRILMCLRHERSLKPDQIRTRFHLPERTALPGVLFLPPLGEKRLRRLVQARLGPRHRDRERIVKESCGNVLLADRLIQMSVRGDGFAQGPLMKSFVVQQLLGLPRGANRVLKKTAERALGVPSTPADRALEIRLLRRHLLKMDFTEQGPMISLYHRSLSCGLTG